MPDDLIYIYISNYYWFLYNTFDSIFKIFFYPLLLKERCLERLLTGKIPDFYKRWQQEFLIPVILFNGIISYTHLVRDFDENAPLWRFSSGHIIFRNLRTRVCNGLCKIIRESAVCIKDRRIVFARKHRAKYLISLYPLNKPLLLSRYSDFSFVANLPQTAGGGERKSNAGPTAVTTTAKKSDRYSIKREIRSRRLCPGLNDCSTAPSFRFRFFWS